MNEALMHEWLKNEAMSISREQWERKPICHITEAVKRDLDQSAIRGLNEYGVTMDRKDLSLLDWLKHQYAELLDAAKYCKKAIEMLENEAKGHE